MCIRPLSEKHACPSFAQHYEFMPLYVPVYTCGASGLVAYPARKPYCVAVKEWRFPGSNDKLHSHETQPLKWKPYCPVAALLPGPGCIINSSTRPAGCGSGLQCKPCVPGSLAPSTALAEQTPCDRACSSQRNAHPRPCKGASLAAHTPRPRQGCAAKRSTALPPARPARWKPSTPNIATLQMLHASKSSLAHVLCHPLCGPRPWPHPQRSLFGSGCRSFRSGWHLGIWTPATAAPCAPQAPAAGSRFPPHTPHLAAVPAASSMAHVRRALARFAALAASASRTFLLRRSLCSAW